MRKSRWVYQKGDVSRVSFAQGWSLGLEAARSLWRPVGRMMGLVGLYFFFALSVAAVPLLGPLLWLLLSVPVAVASMRLEQLELGRARGGDAPRLVDACSLAFERSSLLKMVGLSALSSFSYFLLMAAWFGLISIFASIMDIVPTLNSESSINWFEMGPRLILATTSVLVLLWLAPVMGALWSMVGWSIVIQGEREVPVFARAFKLARQIGPALLAVYLPPAIFGVVFGLPALLLLAHAFSKSSGSLFLGLAGVFIGLCAFGGYLALATLAQARGVHLLCRTAMMRLEAEPEPVVASEPVGPGPGYGTGTLGAD